MATLVGNKHLSISSFIDHVFSIFRRKGYGSNPPEIDIKMLIAAPTQKISTQTNDQKDLA